ncbi:hypothetical protein ACIP1U_22985 [Cupriavidus sp. NPDC089707]|uniref:hypothetical protein n=1 Tax=Cupriavidus sp. NPDC089707 TaxID=3363963 RepID=UPI00380981E6
MPLCDLCLSQLDRPGHFPPHASLLKSATLRTAGGQNAFVYRCSDCGESLLLASADGEAPDRWTRLDVDGWR